MKDPIELAREVLALEPGDYSYAIEDAPILAAEVIRLSELMATSFEEAKEILAEGARDRAQIVDYEAALERAQKWVCEKCCTGGEICVHGHVVACMHVSDTLAKWRKP